MFFWLYAQKAVILHRQTNERLAVFISLTKIIIIPKQPPGEPQNKQIVLR
jgi:hypothetical protein